MFMYCSHEWRFQTGQGGDGLPVFHEVQSIGLRTWGLRVTLSGAVATGGSLTCVVGSWFWLVNLSWFTPTWGLSMCFGLPYNIEAGFQRWVLRERKKERGRDRARQEPHCLLSFRSPIMLPLLYSVHQGGLNGPLWQGEKLDSTFWFSLQEHVKLYLWSGLENIICRTVAPQLCPAKLKWTGQSESGFSESSSTCLSSLTSVEFSNTSSLLMSPYAKVQGLLPKYEEVPTSFKVNSSKKSFLIAPVSHLHLKSFLSETCSSFQDCSGTLNTWDINHGRCFLCLGQGPSTVDRELDTERLPEWAWRER